MRPVDSTAWLLSPSAEARVLWRLRGRVVRAISGQTLTSSRLRLTVVVLLSGVFWASIFAIFWECFYMLRHTIAHEALRVQVVHAVFNLFFLALLLMMTFSSAIISYSLLYRGREVEFLLTMPVRTERLVYYKFQETAAISCWGFLLLGTPMLLAYGIVAESPWYYYVLILPFIVAFVLIPAALGTIVCLLLTRYLAGARFHAIGLAAAAACAVAVGLAWSVLGSSRHDLMTSMWFQETLDRVKYSEQQLLPSWWLSCGLLEAGHPVRGSHGGESWRESLGFLAVLLSTAMLLQCVVGWLGGHLLVAAYSNIIGAGRRQRQAKPAWIDRAFVRLAIWFPWKMRLLLLKDLRLFRRDPVQWSQFLIFFGLLTLYFLNIRRFQYGETLLLWITAIGFLNLAVVGLILSTFTTRFIFPMISLEGRKFWILGSLPVARGEILWGKYLFACTVSLVPCATLIFISDTVLRIVQRTPVIALMHQITCWVLCTGLSALAVGLGARLPNLRETSPAKIAAGFGGTLNLILSAIFIVVVTLATAIPCCFWVVRQRPYVPTNMDIHGLVSRLDLGSTRSVALGLAMTVLLGVLVILMSLRAGFRAFRQLEF